ncbi:MAG: zinc-ribbon domain-containing protein, partial [Candidatus Hermodarchaeota archaeon]
MFCPNCGEKLEATNQRFCASCGSEIQTTLPPEVPDIPQVPVEEPQVPPPAPVYAPKPIKAEGIGSHSKMCFSFSLVAIAIFITGSVFGAGIIIRLIIPVYFFPYLPGGPGLWIIAF